MSPERVWGRIYHCHTCRKALSEEDYKAHVSFGHRAESYVSMPVNVDERVAPVANNLKKEEVKATEDYADVIEEESEEYEIG